MGTEAYIDIALHTPVTPSLFVHALLESGWGMDLDGSVSLLGTAGYANGEWEFIPNANASYILKWAKSLDDAHGGWGILLVHQTTGVGGTLVFDDARTSFAFGISVNIPHLLDDRRLVDFSLCMRALWPAVCVANLEIDTIDMHIE